MTNDKYIEASTKAPNSQELRTSNHDPALPVDPHTNYFHSKLWL